MQAERRRPKADKATENAAATSEAAESGWTAWNGGGKRPVGLRAKIEWMLRDGTICSYLAFPLKKLDWSHEDLHSDIVAYRAVAA